MANKDIGWIDIYLCEYEFLHEDPKNIGYSFTEIDIYQWIPITAQKRLKLPNHRLKVWKNLNSGEYELVMDLMEAMRNEVVIDNQIGILVQNAATGDYIVVEKSTDLTSICKRANKMFRDTWINTSISDVIHEITGDEVVIPDKRSFWTRFVECQHDTSKNPHCMKMASLRQCEFYADPSLCTFRTIYKTIDRCEHKEGMCEILKKQFRRNK